LESRLKVVASRSPIQIGRVVIAALLIEALSIAALISLVALFGPAERAAAQLYAERLGRWVGPISGVVLCCLGGWWVSRRQPRGQVLHGLVLGAAVAAIDIALLLGSGAAFQFLFAASNAGRILAGALGGWLASKPPRASL
jgi:hypothetical protein